MSLTDLGSAFPWPLPRLLLNVTGTAELLGEEAPIVPRGSLHARAQQNILTALKACFLRTLRLPEPCLLEQGLSMLRPPSKRHFKSRGLAYSWSSVRSPPSAGAPGAEPSEVLVPAFAHYAFPAATLIPVSRTSFLVTGWA